MTEEQKHIRLYLLGNLPPKDLAELEVRLLADKGFHEELLVAEDELIDEYLADRLPGAERESFESHFLITPERQQKLSFSKALRKYVKLNELAYPQEETTKSERPASLAGKMWSVKASLLTRTPNRNRVLAFSLIAALVFAASWMAFHNWSSETTVQRQSHNVLKIALISGSTRGDGATQKVLVPAGVDSVQLEIELAGNEYKSYSATLLTPENNILTTREGIRPDVTNGHGVVYFNLPAQILKPGDYQVRLDGISESGKEQVNIYRFRVVNP
jgi:anti-sigma factor RsiW